MDKELIEKAARECCIAEGTDPGAICYGIGGQMPKDWSGPAWEVRIKRVEAVLKVCEQHMYARAEKLLYDLTAEYAKVTEFEVQ